MNTTKIISTALIASPFLASCTVLAQNSQQQKKNILFISADDLKPLLGCYGDPLAKTPNIDRLAARGTVFSNSYCQQAVSGPTRASLFTGLCPDKTQVWDLKTMIRDITPDIVTLPQYLIANGYNTVGIGKNFDPRSVDKGLDVVSWSTPYIDYEHYLDNSQGAIMLASYRNPALRAEIEKYEKEGQALGYKGNKLRNYITEKVKPSTEGMPVSDEAYNDGAIAKGAIEFLNNRKDNKPFFLAVGFKKPHLPFVAPQKYWDMYNRAEMQLAQYRKKALNSPDYAYHNSSELKSYTDIPPVYSFSDINNTVLTDDKARELIHGYYACISYMDAQVGKLLDELDKQGLTKNTIIVLWGDHDWHLGDHGLWNKHTNFEQSAKAPLIIVDPNQKKGNNVTSPVEFLDIFPTICDLSGIKKPANLDGVSLMPAMFKPETKVKDYAVSQFPRGPRMGYSIRTEKYRYTVWVSWKEKESDMTKVLATELYDYVNDPLETVNVAGDKSYASVLKQMESYFNDFKAKRIDKVKVVKLENPSKPGSTED